jgi:hypothetical protein
MGHSQQVICYWICCSWTVVVTSSSDPCGTHNADKDGGPNGVQRRRLELVRGNEAWMSKQSWMARVQTCRYNKWMLWEGEQRQGSVPKLLRTVQIPATLVMWIQAGVLSGVPRTHSTDKAVHESFCESVKNDSWTALSTDQHGAPSGVGIHEYRIAVRWMDNTARVEFWVESERRCEQMSEWCWRRKIHMSAMGKGVKGARIRLEVDKHAGEPWSLPSLCLYTGDASANIAN